MNQGQTIFAQVYGVRLAPRISPLRTEIRWQSKCAATVVLEPVSGHGLRPTDLSPQSSRHRVFLRAQRSKLYHCGFKAPIRRSTLADANERRDWRIYADFARTLIDSARPLYADSDLRLDLEATVYALDATTIDLCLSVFPWATYKRAKGAIKLHTLMEVHSSIPIFIDITHAKVHDVHLLDLLIPEPGSFLSHRSGLYRLCSFVRPSSGAGFLCGARQTKLSASAVALPKPWTA